MFSPKLNIQTYQIYLAGFWRDSISEALLPNINPAHKSEILGYVSETTDAEVDEAMLAADAAFPAWRAVSGNMKTKIFLHLAQVMYARFDDFQRTMSREMGKTLFDCKLDLDEAIGVVECVAPQGLSLKGETYQKNIDGVVMESRLEPRGVAAIITPFNFPIAIPLAQVVAALVVGNTVVWKPSHLIPESSQAIAAALEETFDWAKEKLGVTVPPGTFSMISGDIGPGQALISHPAVKCLSFTGSKTVGDAVDATASGLGKRVMKEVGGINIFYVHKEADIERAAKNFVYGKTITGGQRCTSIQEVFCDESVYEAFVAAAIEETKGIVAGEGLSDELAHADKTPGLYSLPPLVSEEQQARVLGLISQSIREGANIRHQVPVSDALVAEGYYVPFTLIENVSPGNILYTTELFGPVGVLTKVKNITEAITLINQKIGIVACIDSRSKDASEHFIQSVLRTRVDDGRHGTGAFWATRFGGDRGAGSGNPALDENMVMGYVMWKTIYRAYKPFAEPEDDDAGI
ncbi:MAG: aldehyde dehydrogenase family protein [Janthinobacterium lividum]